MCEPPLREGRTCVLLLEDCETDAELVAREVHRALPDAVVHVARGRADFERALAASAPDLVLTDYSLPDFDGPRAIALAGRVAPHAAVLAVTASVSEEAAVACMQAGALDYVLKDRLERLGPSLHMALAVRGARLAAAAAEARLRASEERLRLVTEHASDLLAIVDPHGGVYLSPSYRRLRAHGPGWLGVVSSEDQERAARAFDEGLAARSAWSVEHRAARDDGAPVDLEARGTPVLDPAGAVAHVIVVSRDVTERKRAEEALRLSQEQLRQAQRLEALGRLAGGVAHDFNNLLTAILGFADLLLDRLPPDPLLRQPAEEIRRGGRRGAALTRQLLTFGRQQPAQPQVIDPAARVRSLVPTLEQLVGAGVRLVLELAADVGAVEVDPTGLEQVVLNLAVNAGAAMPGGGTLTIAARDAALVAPLRAARGEAPPGSWVELAVRDTGRGMDERTLARLFEPFFTTKPAGLGTGLGLATVWGVVARSGGHVLVDSAPGRGATFRVLLPRADRAAAPPATSPAGARARGGERLLVVDDDDAVRELMGLALRSAGYAVTAARSGDEALELLAGGDRWPRLLITDVIMPGLSGPELVRRLREARPGLRALFVSGYVPAEGALTDPLLEKPFSPAALVARVRELLDAATAQEA